MQEQNDERGESPVLPVVEYKDNEAAKLRRYDLARTVLKKRSGTVRCEVCPKPISANARWCMKCYARICEQVAVIEGKEAAGESDSETV